MKKFIITATILFALIFSITARSYARNNNKGEPVYTREEVKKMCGVIVDTAKFSRRRAQKDFLYKNYLSNLSKKKGLQKTASETPPPNWKWAMSKVECQNPWYNCGAHAATGVVEGQLQILNKTKTGIESRIGTDGINLNEWEISAGSPIGVFSALNYIKENKISSEVGSYPNLQGAKWSILSITTVTEIDDPIDVIKAYLERGPVTAEFDLYQDFINFFGGPCDLPNSNATKVYHHDPAYKSCDPHAVVIVSYYEDLHDGSKSYWLCKNSWGDTWADGGYFRIGFNECGIDSYDNEYVTVDESCYAKIVPDLITSLPAAFNYSFVSGEAAYVTGNVLITPPAILNFSPSNSFVVTGTLLIKSGVTINNQSALNNPYTLVLNQAKYSDGTNCNSSSYSVNSMNLGPNWSGILVSGTTISLLATSSSSDVFTGWNDGVTYNPRILTSNTSLNSVYIENIASARPQPPTGFTAVPAACGTGTINLSWKSSSGATKYTVTDYSPDTHITSTIYSESGLAFIHAGLVAGSPHDYSITASNTYGTSPPNEIMPCYAPALCAPTGFTAKPVSSSQIDLSWYAVSGANSYTLKGYNGAIIYTGPKTSCSNTGIPCGRSISYALTASNGNDAGTSGPASTSATAPCPPSPPNHLTATAASCGTGTINVSWDASSGAEYYSLKDYSPDTHITSTIYEGRDLAFPHTGLEPGSRHSYSVAASNSFGISRFSEIPMYTCAPDLCPPPPTVSMSVSPESGTQVGSADVTIYYDVDQVATVNIYVDWVYVYGDYLSGSNQWTTTLSAGSHTIRIDAGNNNGGNSVSETYDVLYPPPPSISSLIISAGNIGYYAVGFSVESSNQQVSTDLYVDNSIYCSWQNMGCGDLEANVYLAPGTTHQIKVRSTNNYGGYNEAYASVDVPTPPPPSAPTVSIGAIYQDGINGYDVYFYVESGNQLVSTSYYVDGNIINGTQNTGGYQCTYIYLGPGTHEICFYVQNTYGNNEACTSIEVVPPAYPAPTISQFVYSTTNYGTVIVSFYVDSDDQPVDTRLCYVNSCDEWQNTGGYMSDEVSVPSMWDHILYVEASNAYGSNYDNLSCSVSVSTPGSTAASGSILLKKSGVSGTTNSNGDFVEKNVGILSSKSASFNSPNNATSILSEGRSIVVTSNKNLPRKKTINVLSSNVKKDVDRNKIGTYTVLRKVIEHTWDIKSNQNKKAFISLECPSLDIQSNKGNQKAIKFKNDNQDKNRGNKNASFDMDLSKDDTISTRFKISYSHLNAFGIKMKKGIEFKITVDANESNGKNHDAYQMSIKESLSGQKTDSLGIARLDKAIKWVVPKDMKSIKIVPRITENIIDSSLKVNIAYEIISSQDSIKKDQANTEKGIQMYQEPEVEIPTVFAVSQNYPNPFNPSTVISYQLPGVGTRYIVSLKVYDMLGREVMTLVDGMKEAGYYSATFDAPHLASGVYFARVIASPENGNKPFTKIVKMLLMK